MQSVFHHFSNINYALSLLIEERPMGTPPWEACDQTTVVEPADRRKADGYAAMGGL
jgi:hypothetical protein